MIIAGSEPLTSTLLAAQTGHARHCRSGNRSDNFHDIGRHAPRFVI